MATIKNTSLFTALTGAITQITSNDNGYKALSVIKANFTENGTTKNYVDSFAYGEYSLANIAQVTNTISELAKHVYNNFIPNDRIIPNKKADTKTDIIFYKKVGNAYDNMSDTISGKAANYKNYIITGQNLYNNIKYHKPFINNTQDYSESNYFITPTGIPNTEAGNALQAQRVGSAYVWNANKNADWYRVHILPDAPTTGKTAYNDYLINSTTKTLDIKIDNTLTGTGLTDNTVTLLNDTLGKETFTFSSAGLVKTVNKSDGYAISGDGLNGKTVNVLTDSLEKRKITFTDAGLVQKVEKAGEYTLTGSVKDNSNSVIVLNKDFGFEKFTFTDAGLVQEVDNTGENYTLTGNVTDNNNTVTVLNKDFGFEEFTFTEHGLVEKVNNTGDKYIVEGLSDDKTVSVLTNNLEKRDFAFTENGLLKSVGEGTALNTLTGLSGGAITLLDNSFKKRDFTFTTAGLLNKVEDKGAVNTVAGMPTNKKITLLNDSFGRETFTLTDAGLITEIESTAGDTISGLDSGEITLLNSSLEKKKLTFSDAGILTKVEDNGGKLNTLSGTGLSSDKKITLLSGDFALEEFAFTENGLVNTVTKGNSFTVLKDTAAVSSDFTFDVLLMPDSSGDTVKKTTLTFNKYGLLTKYTTPAATSYKLMYEGNVQSFTGLKTFSSGIGLPGSTGDLIVG